MNLFETLYEILGIAPKTEKVEKTDTDIEEVATEVDKGDEEE